MYRWLLTILLQVLGFSLTCCATKHYIYWNRFVNTDLLKGRVQKVKMGEFLDILCPQTSLMKTTGTNGPIKAEVFNLYNVSEYEYSKCSTQGKEDMIFQCNKPDRENKLTIKFQTFSPSPFGFKFQYCRDYYIIGKVDENLKGKNAGCHKNSTRLKISVACKDTPDDELKSTTTVSTKTTTTTTTVKTKSSTILEDLIKTKETIFQPDIKTLSTKKPGDSKDAKSEKVYGGGANSRRSNFTTILTISAFLNFVVRCLNT